MKTNWTRLGKTMVGVAAAYGYETTIVANVKDATNFSGMPVAKVLAQPIFWGNVVTGLAPLVVAGMFVAGRRSPVAMGYLGGSLYQRFDNIGRTFGLPRTV